MHALPDIEQWTIQLIVSVAFAFLIGMEVYTRTSQEERPYLYGTERTLSFIALLGFIFLRADASLPHLYLAGLFILALFLTAYYIGKLRTNSHYGLTLIILAVIVYTFPLILQILPFWMSMLIITGVMVLVEIKDRIKEFAQKIYTGDYLTLAKFVILTGVILPLVPDKQIIPGVPVSPYKLWLAIVAISAISYLSYILKKYVFPKAGLMMTAILGGLYSSTATTFILAKKSRDGNEQPQHYAAAILSATSLMFLRIYILVLIFNPALGGHLLPYFIILIAVSALTTFIIYRMAPKAATGQATEVMARQNPLELRVALVFGLLYVVFSLLTQYTIQYFGHNGLNVLSYIVGVTDIDPFLLNMFQGKYADITAAAICTATLQAVASNNILKTIYALVLGDKSIRKYVLGGFAVIIATNIILVFFL